MTTQEADVEIRYRQLGGTTPITLIEWAEIILAGIGLAAILTVF